jgi:hypothetical protein
MQQGMVILCTTISLTGFGPKACLPLVVTPKTAKAQVFNFSYIPSILNLHILKLWLDHTAISIKVVHE